MPRSCLVCDFDDGVPHAHNESVALEGHASNATDLRAILLREEHGLEPAEIVKWILKSHREFPHQVAFANVRVAQFWPRRQNPR